MRDNRKNLESKIVILRNNNNSIFLGISFVKWIFIGSIVGMLTGSAAALFLNSLELVTNLRIQNPWLLFFFPLEVPL